MIRIFKNKSNSWKSNLGKVIILVAIIIACTSLFMEWTSPGSIQSSGDTVGDLARDARLAEEGFVAQGFQHQGVFFVSFIYLYFLIKALRDKKISKMNIILFWGGTITFGILKLMISPYFHRNADYGLGIFLFISSIIILFIGLKLYDDKFDKQKEKLSFSKLDIGRKSIIISAGIIIFLILSISLLVGAHENLTLNQIIFDLISFIMFYLASYLSIKAINKKFIDKKKSSISVLVILLALAIYLFVEDAPFLIYLIAATPFMILLFGINKVSHPYS
ncbi:hypothetical protein [Acetohalobium arabaticum]|uniref:Uncharacterized protein n=1 Tax=Acetohalobium arabaticum (strain ATCC 49924 / DSM 5501 / Z-7288) TaxID=574087 RepID=D9QV11_ACEAZ|nr:hypothetical protein [Acetohalobium arabaticum]ADL12070.1 hypothetical protein Acear_0524 [Acetohalobium arabaticum DSM 5501]